MRERRREHRLDPVLLIAGLLAAVGAAVAFALRPGPLPLDAES